MAAERVKAGDRAGDATCAERLLVSADGACFGLALVAFVTNRLDWRRWIHLPEDDLVYAIAAGLGTEGQDFCFLAPLDGRTTCTRLFAFELRVLDAVRRESKRQRGKRNVPD